MELELEYREAEAATTTTTPTKPPPTTDHDDHNDNHHHRAHHDDRHWKYDERRAHNHDGGSDYNDHDGGSDYNDHDGGSDYNDHNAAYHHDNAAFRIVRVLRRHDQLAPRADGQLGEDIPRGRRPRDGSVAPHGWPPPRSRDRLLRVGRYGRVRPG